MLGGVPFAFLGGYLAIDGAPYDTVLSVVLLLAAVRLVMPAEMEARGGSGGIGFLPCTLMGMGIGLVSGVVGDRWRGAPFPPPDRLLFGNT